jgi:catechol 2,3-dioxygenase-like lactoylglutathione lyase family enzyme
VDCKISLRIAFARSSAKHETTPPALLPRAANSRVPGYQRAVPDHLGHVGVFTPEMDVMAEFYRDRLGFTMSDSIRGFGKFMRAPGSINHHNILFANRPRPGMQHLSFRLRDLDELGAGMRYLERCGWPRIWGPGRHRPGSDIFVFFVNPAGGLVEYHFDEDFIVDPAAWEPTEFEPQNLSLWGDRPENMGAPPELARSTG